MNSCSVGYTGLDCGKCPAGFYRYGQSCQTCPDLDLPVADILLIVFAVLTVALFLVNILRKIDLGFTSILVTYLQTVAIFQTFKLQWPKLVLAMFGYISALNLNIELTSPECFIAEGNDKSYEYKFYVTLALPIAFIVVIIMLLGLNFSFVAIRKSTSKPKPETYSVDNGQEVQEPVKKSFWSIGGGIDRIDLLHEDIGQNQSTAASLISIFVLAHKIMYLMLANRALELYDCAYDASKGFFFAAEPNRKCFIESW